MCILAFILFSICTIKCNSCFIIKGPLCSSSCTNSENLDICHFSCKTYHCASSAMCKDLQNKFVVRKNFSQEITNIISSIDNVCTTFAQKDWDCLDNKKSPICVTCNDYLTVANESCASHCNDICYLDPICNKIKQLYALNSDYNYQNIVEQNVIKNIAIGIMTHCSDGYSLKYQLSSIWIFFILLLTK